VLVTVYHYIGIKNLINYQKEVGIGQLKKVQYYQIQKDMMLAMMLI
jgi:hypothetical protein